MVSQEHEKFIKLLKVYLILGGLWEYVSTGSTKSKIYRTYSILIKMSFVIFCILVWVEYLRLIIQKFDNELIMSQLFLMVIMEKEELVWNQDDDEIKKFYRRKVKECQNLMAFLIFLNCMGGLMNALYGAYELFELKRTQNETVESHYGFQIWLPIDKFNHIYIFGTIQLWLVWSGHVGYCITVLISPLLFKFVSVQLGILEIKIRKLIPSDTATFDMETKIMELKNLIREHQYIIKFLQSLNNAIKNFILLEFLTNLIDIGSSLVNTMEIDTLRWMFLVMAVVMLLLMQIFFLSLTSNEVKIQSERIANAAFESKWYLLNKEGKYLIYFMIARAQRPLTITIGHFGPMTTETVITILRAAYSYISVIKGQ